MLVRNTIIYGATRGAAGLLNFLAVVLYSRLLAPAEYGRYALLIATVAIASAGLFQWLRSGARRFLAAHLERREAFLATLARGYLTMLAAAMAACAVVWVAWPSGEPRVFLPLGLAIFGAQGWYDLTLELMLVDLQPVRYGLVTLARSTVGLGVAVALAAAGLGAPGVLAGVLLGYLLPPLLLARGSWGVIRLERASPAMRRELLQYGLPLTATFALEFIVSSSDRFLLGTLAGVDEVGRYAVSYDLGFQTVTALLMIVNLAAFPLSVRAVEAKGPSGAEGDLRRHGTLLLLIAAPAVLGIVLLRSNIAHVVIGPPFRAAAETVLPLIAVAALLAGLKAYYFDLSYQLGRATRIQVWVSGAAAILNVALNLWWIPRFGVAGAAYATLVAYAAGCGLSWGLGSLGTRIPVPWGTWGRISLAAMAMGLVLVPLAAWRGVVALTTQVVVGAAAYGLLVLALNIVGSRAIAQRVVLVLRSRWTA